MSDSTKRAKVPKPAKKSATKGEADAETGARKETGTETAAAPVSTDDDLIDIPHVKKKKERHVKTEADIAAKQERKRLRKEAEQAKREAKLAKKGLAVQKAAIQNKVPKWKQFMKNTTEGDNAEKLKDTSYKVKGDDGSSDDDDSSSDSDSSDNDSKREKSSKSKRQLDDQSESNNSSSKSKKAKQVDDATLATLDTSIPGKSCIFGGMEEIKDNMEVPKASTDLAAQSHAAVQDAKKIVEAPEPEEEDKDQDQEMKEPEAEEESTIPLSEEEKAAEEASKQAKIEAKRVAKVKSSRALDLLKVLA
ncbi:hypothetical protein BGX31_009628 [Mortierella sp. GBA43]|nr:hypothetical protein BGX31_009628 [Mortierella sp. GBA43]